MIGVRKRIGAAAGLAALVFAGAVTSASAATTTVGLIGVSGGPPPRTETSVQATVTCTNSTDPVCVGLVDSDDLFDGLDGSFFDTTSPYVADPFDINSGEASQQAAAEAILGAPTTGTKFERNEIIGCTEGLCSFQTSAALILIKAGVGSYFLSNQTGGLISLLFEQTGQGVGFSHVTTFGGRVTNVIPVPAALPLFLTALGGLGFLGWRRRREHATA